MGQLAQRWAACLLILALAFSGSSARFLLQDSTAIATAVANGNGEAVATAIASAGNGGSATAIAIAISDGYQRNPTAGASALAQALSLASSRGFAAAAAAVIAAALQSGGYQATAFSQALAVANANNYAIQPVLSGVPPGLLSRAPGLNLGNLGLGQTGVIPGGQVVREGSRDGRVDGRGLGINSGFGNNPFGNNQATAQSVAFADSRGGFLG